jgi:hypothetical protein
MEVFDLVTTRQAAGLPLPAPAAAWTPALLADVAALAVEHFVHYAGGAEVGVRLGVGRFIHELLVRMEAIAGGGAVPGAVPPTYFPPSTNGARVCLYGECCVGLYVCAHTLAQERGGCASGHVHGCAHEWGLCMCARAAPAVPVCHERRIRCFATTAWPPPPPSVPCLRPAHSASLAR